MQFWEIYANNLSTHFRPLVGIPMSGVFFSLDTAQIRHKGSVVQKTADPIDFLWVYIKINWAENAWTE